jgi:hypothetical protein
VSAIVLDPNNDLARLGLPWPAPPPAWGEGDAARAARYLDETDVVVWTPRRSTGRPLTFRPLGDLGAFLDDPDDFRSAIDAAVASLVPRCGLPKTGPRADQGQAVLHQALARFARDGGRDLAPFLDYLDDLPADVSRIADAVALADRMAQTLRAAMVNDPMFGGDGTPIDPGVLTTPAPGKRARVSVISLVGLTTDEQRQSFVNQLQVNLFAWARRHPAGDRPLGLLYVMDEAQTFAPSGAGTPCTHGTVTLAAQARKFGVGLLFATLAVERLACAPAAFRRRRTVLHEAEIGIGERGLLLRLVERVRDRQLRLEAAQFLDDGEPLLLVHGVPRDQERQHILHAGIVLHRMEPHGQHASRSFGRGVGQHVAGDVARGVDVRHAERRAVGIDREGGEAGRQEVPHVHAVEHTAGDGIAGHLLLEADRCFLEVQRHRRRQHLDVA